MMRVLIPHWKDRISPVFDVAGTGLLVEIHDVREVSRTDCRIDAIDPLARARQVIGYGANVIICCAISRPLELALQSSGVRVISQICGPVDDILAAFISGQLTNDLFGMPGYSCVGRQFRSRHRRGRRHQGR